MLRMSHSRLVSRAGASAIFAVAMTLSNVAASQAMSITPGSVNPWQHIVDCWGAMVAGDPVHATDCSPGQPGSNTTLVTPVPGGGSGAPPCTPRLTGELDSYKLASLDESIMPSSGGARSGDTYAATCGDCASLAEPAFSSYNVASLDNSIMPRRSLPTEPQIKLAQSVSCDLQ